METAAQDEALNVMPMGPQAGGGFISPSPQQPQGGDHYADWSMQNQAQQEALMHAMHGMLGQQGQQNVQTAGEGLARGANQAFGNPVGQLLRPIGQAVRSGAGAVRSGLGFGSQAPAQSYTMGGQTTLGASAAPGAGTAASSLSGASSLPAEAAGPASASVAAPTLGSYVAPALSLVGSGYAAYAGIENANRATGNLHQAISYGLSPEQEAQLRQEQFDKGIGSFGVGSGVGALGGFLSAGPVGAVIGGVAGGAGGATQAYNAYDNPHDAFKAFADLPRHPLSAFH